MYVYNSYFMILYNWDAKNLTWVTYHITRDMSHPCKKEDSPLPERSCPRWMSPPVPRPAARCPVRRDRRHGRRPSLWWTRSLGTAPASAPPPHSPPSVPLCQPRTGRPPARRGRGCAPHSSLPWCRAGACPQERTQTLGCCSNWTIAILARGQNVRDDQHILIINCPK